MAYESPNDRAAPAVAVDRALAMLEEARSMARETLAGARAFLASPQGRVVRERVAVALVFAAPLVVRIPAVRASRLSRALGSAALAGLMIKLAEALREWPPEQAEFAPSEPRAVP